MAGAPREKRRQERLEFAARARVLPGRSCCRLPRQRRQTRSGVSFWIADRRAYPVVAIHCGALVARSECSYCAEHAAITFAR
jgi:hypothetical protein